MLKTILLYSIHFQQFGRNYSIMQQYAQLSSNSLSYILDFCMFCATTEGLPKF